MHAYRSSLLGAWEAAGLPPLAYKREREQSPELIFIFSPPALLLLRLAAILPELPWR
jgi:hypothetical protein